LLPERVSSTGEVIPTYKGQRGLERAMNVFFNPAFKDEYKPQPGARLVTDLFERSGGETRQYPRGLSPITGLTVYGTRIPLTQEERNTLQKYIGTESMDRLNNLSKQNWAWTAPAEDVAKFIDNKILNVSRELAVDRFVRELGQDEIFKRIKAEGKEPVVKSRIIRRR
jgi:hypothetical protein